MYGSLEVESLLRGGRQCVQHVATVAPPVRHILCAGFQPPTMTGRPVPSHPIQDQVPVTVSDSQGNTSLSAYQYHAGHCPLFNLKKPPPPIRRICSPTAWALVLSEGMDGWSLAIYIYGYSQRLKCSRIKHHGIICSGKSSSISNEEYLNLQCH